SNDTVMNTMLYTNYKNKVTSYYVGTDLKTWVCQKIITRKNIYLYESIGVSMFLPLGSVKEMNATVDTFLVKNNSLYFQSRSIINSSKKESPYYYKIRGVDDFNHYFTPHIDLGGIFDVNNIQIVCGFKLYFLTKPYRIYPQDKIIRLNFNVFF
ncbi:MAG: hypothetical protein N2203_08870, partial [Bacteroidia bacterium]|nr:hypothetical protein [Bacteroidia bacterium]